jgi:hypothetical protein
MGKAFITLARLPVLVPLAVSCTSIAPEAVDIELEYQEKIIVSGMIHAGDTIQNIRILRTYPATQDSEEDKTALPDAQAQIIIDNRSYMMELQPEVPDTRFVPPRIDKRSFFRVPGLIAQAGKTYRILVRWKGMSAEATTTIPPLPPPIDSYRFTVELDGPIGIQLPALYASFKPRPDECYQMVAQMKRKFLRNPYEPITFVSGQSDIARQGNADANNIVSLKIPYLNIATNEIEKFDSLYTGDIIFYAYDTAYFDYQRSVARRTNDIVFNVPTTNPKWNVTGDGIGLFIGVATSRTPLTRKVR